MSESKETNRVLTDKDITKLGIRSSLLQASFNYERMQAGGFLDAQLPALEKIYKDDPEGLKAAMTDNMEFINTHPNLVGFLMGLLISLEEKHEDRYVIKGLKVALFGPIAGIGDAIFWFTLLPIIAGISCSFAAQGSILGPIIFFACYLVIWLLRINWTHLGYNLGLKSFTKLQEDSEIISNSATILGVTVVGALIANYVSINLKPVISIGDNISVSVQEAFLDTIFPNLLPMAYTLLMLYFLKKKQVSPVVLILVTIAIALISSLIGLM
ncbi:MAG: PTS galactosamine transporter subunit IID [Lachnospiraceae bacterium]|uniref:PTS galactosamine transporter subunit IID n=2 Tax=Galactobacillus timonensis TaxID=2041840 RepID=UPI0023F13C0E|nr:PTS galactosamine transporter subunit IID [Galactobacillus timonensis]MDD7087015.1 PTS galactosamine transporter subunit IID [Galactobacillus timonensis]MDY5222560.1 PTS galactosamine transporter subunit IID [Lachnospiraceae bacterium]